MPIGRLAARLRRTGIARVAAPFCGTIPADFGAEAIKPEQPGAGNLEIQPESGRVEPRMVRVAGKREGGGCAAPPGGGSFSPWMRASSRLMA